jgi:hypothetical protein
MQAAQTETSPKIWRIHIGAHKTATTHLQDTLADQMENLKQVGIRYLSREYIRNSKIKIKTSSVIKTVGAEFIFAKRFREKILEGFYMHNNFIISEENFLGSVQEVFNSKIYPRAETRLSFLKKSLKRDKDSIYLFLAIRSQAELISSAYAQILRHRPIPGGFDSISRRVMIDPPRWFDLVRRIRLVMGKDCQVCIWLYESYRSNEQRILSRICGCDLPISNSLPSPNSTRTPSSEAIREIEKVGAVAPKADYIRLVREITLSDNGSNRFCPFNKQEKEFLYSVYEDDIRKIRTYESTNHFDNCFILDS